MGLTVAQILLLAAGMPLLSFVLLIFFGRRMGYMAGAVGTLLIVVTLGLSVTASIEWVAKAEFNQRHYVEALAYPWITLPGVGAENPATPRVLANSVGSALVMGVLVDSLTVTMFVMVSLVASVVHLFSMAYMKEDPRYSRYFAYLGLFCFSMLGLVLANSLIQMFVFWELVGICSYLLIGFWFEKRGPALASKKAVLVNRVGDVSFLIGIGILLLHLGPASLTFFDGQGNAVLSSAVQTAVHQEMGGAEGLQGFARLLSPEGANYLTHNFGATFWGYNWLTWAGLCIFGGAMAKSAQFPLHVWLPDAMEGPTPVSALIHAATMVAAGVYLVARVFPILTMDARLVIAIIGCITLLAGALIALVQTDIKRVLAYSTISQLGYMMLFLGSGGYVAGLFHLFTHAFFKSCLFLAAGSVIHALSGEQDMRRMGGLWKKMPITAGTFLLAVLAISGTPYFSGYYSKELGLAGVYEYAMALHQQSLDRHLAMMLFWVPVATSYLTAFYMWRCWWLTFGGKARDEELGEHAHETSLMTLSLIFLGGLSVVAGYEFFRVPSVLGKSLPAVMALGGGEALTLSVMPSEDVQAMVSQWAIWAFVAGPVAAIGIYFAGFGLANRVRRLPGVNLVYLWLVEGMYFDALYDGILVNGTKAFSVTLGFVDRYVVDGVVNMAGYAMRGVSRLSGLMDARVVDGAVNGLAEAARLGGRGVLAPQGGRIRIYVLGLFTVLAAVAVGTVVYVLAAR